MRNTFLVRLVLFLGLISVVSVKASIEPSTIRQHGFVYCTNGVVSSFNPQLSSSGLLVNTLSSQLYNSLLDIDPNTYRLIPSLAKSWEVSDKGATYRFFLRSDVSFHNTPWFTPTRKMNADDVVFSFERIFNPLHPWHQVNHGMYPYFNSLQLIQTVKSIKKLSQNSLEIRLDRPNNAFLWHLATQYAPILSAEYAHLLTTEKKEGKLDYYPVGTGPFMLNEYHVGEYIRLARNKDYWKGASKMSQVVIDISAGGKGRLSELLTGECDVLAYPAASQLSVLKNDPRLRLLLRPAMNMAYLAFNTRKSPLDRAEVRSALALAINRERLIKSIYYGTAESAPSILPRVSWAYDKSLDLSEYNPQKSRDILKQLGINQLKLTLLVTLSPESWNPSPLKMAELIRSDLEQVGVDVRIVTVDDRYQDPLLVKKNQDITLTGWTSGNDPDSFFRPLLSCAAIHSQTNYAYWCNPEFDSLLHEAVSSQELASRIEYYKNAQQILARELPVLPLASSLRLLAYRYDIKGLVISAFGSASFSTVYREDPYAEEKNKQ